MSHRFDLSTAPLIKTVLIQLSTEEHWFLILMHHIIIDGWSYGILLQELETLYSTFLVDKPSPLPELPFQYADFAIWQRALLNPAMKFGVSAARSAALTPNFIAQISNAWQRNYFSEEVLATHLLYWHQHLANLPTSLDLLPARSLYQ